MNGSRWIVAGTLVSEPYPCLCSERRGYACSPKWCRCSGRVDLQNVPPDCCAHWHTPEAYVEAWREARQ